MQTREKWREEMQEEKAQICAEAVCVSEKRMRERSGEKDEVRTETEEADKASSSLVAKCPRLSPTGSTPHRAPGATTGLRAAASPLLPPAAGGAPRARPPRLPGRRPARPERWEGGSSERASERAREGGRGCRWEATMWFQLTLFFPPSLSSLLFLSKQGKVFHEAVGSFCLAFSSLTRVPAPVRVPAGRASAGSPSAPVAGIPERGARRGAAPAPAHGCSRPAHTPRRRAQLARGPSAEPARPGAKQRLSGEEPAPGHRDDPPRPARAR